MQGKLQVSNPVHSVTAYVKSMPSTLPRCKILVIFQRGVNRSEVNGYQLFGAELCNGKRLRHLVLAAENCCPNTCMNGRQLPPRQNAPNLQPWSLVERDLYRRFPNSCSIASVPAWFPVRNRAGTKEHNLQHVTQQVLPPPVLTSRPSSPLLRFAVHALCMQRSKFARPLMLSTAIPHEFFHDVSCRGYRRESE
eukprot:scaffold499_cov335-Pavlova_lutheri.AAC.20